MVFHLKVPEGMQPRRAYAKTWSGVKPWGGVMEWCGFLEWFFGVGFWSHL